VDIGFIDHFTTQLIIIIIIIYFLFEYWGVDSILDALGTAVITGLLYLPRVIVRMEKFVE
jgi:hypothetical protein